MLSVSGQCGGSSAVSLACIISMCFVQRFLGASLFVWPLDHSFHSFTPIPPPPFIFPLMNQCDRCLVPLAWELMAGRRGFTRGSPVPDVQLVECGVRMMGSVLNRTRRKRGGKNEGCVGRVPSLFPLQSLPFFFLVNFFTALYYLNAWNRLTRGWLCQKWKPLDKTGTHLH